MKKNMSFPFRLENDGGFVNILRNDYERFENEKSRNSWSTRRNMHNIGVRTAGIYRMEYEARTGRLHFSPDVRTFYCGSYHLGYLWN
jgi:hypothetical protein